MPTVHKVLTAEKHPNADRLRVYNMVETANVYMKENDQGVTEFFRPTRQIVANLTNIYEVGDDVNIIIPGEEFEGTVMAETEIRGVKSEGMAIGKTHNHLVSER